MDTLTHALVGAALAHATSPKNSPLPARHRVALGALAAALPDADFALFVVDPLRFLAHWHQGPTHSFVLLPLWAALVAAAYVRFGGSASAFRAAWAACALAIGSHIAADAITAYGTAVLYPLSDVRIALGTTFVIDPLFTAIVLVGLAAALHSRRRRPAAAGLVVLCAYVGGQALLQQQALGLVRAQGTTFERAVALAQPFSPFNWKLIGTQGTRHHEAHVNLLGHAPAPLPAPLAVAASAYRPPQRIEWRVRERFGTDPDRQALAAQRWNDPRFADYRRFARFPALSRIDERGGETCVWFTDLRYDLPGMADTFRYGFCRSGDSGEWLPYRLRYFAADDRRRIAR